jgi:hydrogenase/urease accessory protein HupE
MKLKAPVLSLVSALLLCFVASPALAHKTIINAVRLDVRPREQSVAAIFRLNTLPMQSWLRTESKGQVSDLKRLGEFRAQFEQYLYSQVGLSHAGGACQHPDRLFVFHFDEPRGSILATTSFKCGDTLPNKLTFSSTLFKDEEIAQDMIVQVENRGKRGTFILNTKGRKSVEFDIDQLLDIGGKLKQVYDAEKTQAAIDGDLSSKDHVDDDPALRGMSTWEIAVDYVKEGFLHIWTGPDHLLFVFSLVLAIFALRNLVLVLTCFTVGHSVSLALGAFDVFRVRASIIEPLVALTILLVVVDNGLRKDPSRQRPLVALFFGVIHGFAFSQTLWDLEVLESIVAPLVGFNVGVELGQLALVAPLFPALAWLRKNKPQAFTPFYRVCNVAIGCAALFWIYQRLTEM